MNTQKFDFYKYKYGLFIHYVHGLSMFSDGRKPKDINETLDSFDAEGFAQDVADMGVQYLVLTSWHWKMIPLYPSEVNAKWRGKEIAKRDLLGDIIDAVNARGVKVILYTHPRDGHDFDSADRVATGWGEGKREGGGNDSANPKTFNTEKWNAYVKDLYTELADRYAHKLYGFYTDGVGPHDGRESAMENNLQIVDYLMIRDIMKSRNPDIVMIQNHFGYIFSDDFEMPEGYFGFENNALKNCIEKMPAAQKSLAMSPFDDAWMPGLDFDSKDENSCVTPVENATKFVLFNASCTLGGGTIYATGPYSEGNVWVSGVLDYLKTIGKKVNEYKESILDAKTSKSYPTISGDTLEALGNKFFMTSDDDRYEYLHIMSEQNEIVLPLSLDGAKLYAPISLTKGLKVDSFDGCKLTLSGKFDCIDSVIRFKRKDPDNAPEIEWINDSNKRFRYNDGWKYYRLDSREDRQKVTYGCYESDAHHSLEVGASAFIAFEGSVVEIYGRGQVSVFIDGVKLADVECDLTNDGRRNLIYTTMDLHGGWHTLYLVTNKEFDFDAIKVIK